MKGQKRTVTVSIVDETLVAILDHDSSSADCGFRQRQSAGKQSEGRRSRCESGRQGRGQTQSVRQNGVSPSARPRSRQTDCHRQGEPSDPARSAPHGQCRDRAEACFSRAESEWCAGQIFRPAGRCQGRMDDRERRIGPTHLGRGHDMHSTPRLRGSHVVELRFDRGGEKDRRKRRDWEFTSTGWRPGHHRDFSLAENHGIRFSRTTALDGDWGLRERCDEPGQRVPLLIEPVVFAEDRSTRRQRFEPIWTACYSLNGPTRGSRTAGLASSQT